RARGLEEFSSMTFRIRLCTVLLIALSLAVLPASRPTGPSPAYAAESEPSTPTAPDSQACSPSSLPEGSWSRLAAERDDSSRESLCQLSEALQRPAEPEPDAEPVDVSTPIWEFPEPEPGLPLAVPDSIRRFEAEIIEAAK